MVQWRVRLLGLACWVAPGAFVALVSRQSALPADTVFGRLMSSTIYAPDDVPGAAIPGVDGDR